MRNFDEKKLVSKLDKILRKEFGTNLAFHEFSAGYGIADLVFAPNFSFKKNLLNRKPLTSFNSLKILLTLDDQKPYKLSELIDTFPHLTLSEIKKQLKTLINSKYLQKVSKDLYVKTLVKEQMNPINKIIAVEVKLNDHKNGLMQARRYQYFADESYLAILKESEKNINFDEFNRYNIGLILFDNSKGTIEIKHPEPMNFHFENTVSLFAKEMMMNRFIQVSF
ncbi:MAG: hypothetical protein ACR2LN_05215 [Candidatus Levyibacteriota bacterium]